jgi:hypothetical protein
MLRLLTKSLMVLFYNNEVFKKFPLKAIKKLQLSIDIESMPSVILFNDMKQYAPFYFFASY